MIVKAIYSLLSHNSSITDLVGTKIYPLIRDQKDGLPAITYQVISGIRENDLSGPTGLVEGRLQINCFASTVLGAENLAKVVREALSGLTGGAEGIRIECMLLEDQSDLPTFAADNEEMNVYAQMMDFYVLYKE